MKEVSTTFSPTDGPETHDFMIIEEATAKPPEEVITLSVPPAHVVANGLAESIKAKKMTPAQAVTMFSNWYPGVEPPVFFYHSDL